MALRAVPCPHLPRLASISLLLIQASIYCRVHPVLSPPIYRCCRPNSFVRSSPATASRTSMPTAIPSRSFCQTLSRSTRLRWGPRCSTKCLASTVSFPGNTDKAFGRPKTLLSPKGVLYTRASRRVPTPPRGSDSQDSLVSRDEAGPARACAAAALVPRPMSSAVEV